VRHTQLVKGAQPLPNYRQRANDAEMTDQIVRDQRPRRRQITITTQRREATSGGKRLSGSHRHSHLTEQRRNIDTLGPDDLVGVSVGTLSPGASPGAVW
jgi:hypothetical protein